MKKKVVGGIIVLVILTIGSYGIQQLSNSAVEVAAYEANLERYDEVVSGIGYVEYEKEIVIKSEVSGVIKGLNGSRGELIKVGDELISLDDLQAQQRYQELEASVNLVKARYDDYMDDYYSRVGTVKDQTAIKQKELEILEVNIQYLTDKIQETRILVEEGILSSSELDNLNNQMVVLDKNIEAKKVELKGLRNPVLLSKELEASVKYANNQLIQQGLELEKYIIRAPLEGVITEVFIDAGEYVQLGQDLLKIADNKNKYVVIDVDEKYLSAFSREQEALLTLDAYPNKTMKGIIKDIAPVVDLETGTIEVKVLIIEDSDLFLQNMAVRVDITTFSFDSVVVIPGEYLVNNEGLFVYQADDLGVVYQTRVKVFNRNLSKVMVTEGLEEGSIILNPQELEVGMKVKVIKEKS